MKDPSSQATVLRSSPIAVTRALNLADWRGDRYSGDPPERRWLINHVIPLGVPCMLAATGGIGKSLVVLKLALEVATGDLHNRKTDEPDRVLGGAVARHGSAVIITAEDDADEVHRRICALDPLKQRDQRVDKLIIVPLPNAGGTLTLLRGGSENPQATREFEELRTQLLQIQDLKLIVFDPLQAFVGADANKDPAAGQYLCTLLGKLAADTGATVMVTHHFRKQGRIKGPAEAREAVRGTTALIDGMRCVYAFWPAEESYGKKICRTLRIKYAPNKVILGAVVKANGPVEMRTDTYVRDDQGLLRNHTENLFQHEDSEAMLNKLVDSISDAARHGKPYTMSGRKGVHERRHELMPDLRGIGRNRLQDMVQQLIDEGRIKKYAGRKLSVAQWLDVPDGPFATGNGQFAPEDPSPPRR